MNLPVFKQPVFFRVTKDEQKRIVDVAVQTDNGDWAGHYGGKTLKQLQGEDSSIALGEHEAIHVEIEQSQITQPIEISEDAFEYAFEVLPPLDYQCDATGMSFKSEELLSGRITANYAQIGGRYFQFNDLDTTPHRAIIDKVRASLV